jgi:hypothetical protein
MISSQVMSFRFPDNPQGKTLIEHRAHEWAGTGLDNLICMRCRTSWKHTKVDDAKCSKQYGTLDGGWLPRSPAGINRAQYEH